MSLEVERAKIDHNIRIDFFEWLILRQIFFETNLIATDGTLHDHNTVQYGITRGVIGEAQEALEYLEKIREVEILTPDNEALLAELREALKFELADIVVFLASVVHHAGMTPAELIDKTATKMDRNFQKYDQGNFDGRTIKEGIQLSRDKWDRHTPEQRYEERRLNGHPMPRTGDLFGATPEPEYSTAGAGAIT
jgi:NTP pyrophosphatase (non-canonical NTP hydrolase)